MLGLLGGVQGLVTTLSFILVEVMVEKPSLSQRLISSLIGGGVLTCLLFILFRFAGTLPPIPYSTLLAAGFILFSITSGAVILVIPEIRRQYSLFKQTFYAAITAGVAGWLAILLVYQLLDLSAGSPVLEAAVFYAALESMFGAGMALGLGLASRLGYMLRPGVMTGQPRSNAQSKFLSHINKDQEG